MKKDNILGYEIRSLSNLIGRLVDIRTEEVSDSNLSGTCGLIIGYLSRNPDEDVYQRDIEDKFGIRRSTVSRVVALLEERGLLVRTTVGYDGRLKKLALTEKSKEIYKNAKLEIDKIDEELVAGLSPEEIETYIRITQRMKENLACKDLKAY